MEPDGSSASEMSLDARTRRYEAGTTGHRGQFRRKTGFLVLFGDSRRLFFPRKCPSELSIWGMSAKTILARASRMWLKRRLGAVQRSLAGLFYP